MGGNLLTNTQFDFLSGDWCDCGTAGSTIGGQCTNERPSFLPDLPPSLLQGQALPLARLEQILSDPNYGNFGILLYRFPADSLNPEIQFIKRNEVWMVLVFRAPEQYRPATRLLTARQVLQTMVNYLSGEQVYPRQVEFIGSTPSQHRVWIDVHY